VAIMMCLDYRTAEKPFVKVVPPREFIALEPFVAVKVDHGRFCHPSWRKWIVEAPPWPRDIARALLLVIPN
jgi:hypothetical protein